MAENDAEPKAGSGLVKKLLIFGGGGLLLIAIGLGAGFLIFGGGQPDPSEEIEEIIERTMQEREAAELEESDNSTPQKLSKDTPEEEVFETIYHEFPGTFTTNLAGSRKMLQVGVGVSTQYDDTVMMNVESHQLALRSVILGVISDFTEEDVKAQQAETSLPWRFAKPSTPNSRRWRISAVSRKYISPPSSYNKERGRIEFEVATWHQHGNSAVMKLTPLLKGLAVTIPHHPPLWKVMTSARFSLDLMIFHCWATTMRFGSLMSDLPGSHAQYFYRCCEFSRAFPLSHQR